MLNSRIARRLKLSRREGKWNDQSEVEYNGVLHSRNLNAVLCE